MDMKERASWTAGLLEQSIERGGAKGMVYRAQRCYVTVVASCEKR
jgi:hypothetical protein